MYTFWNHDTLRNRKIRYLNFEPNVDVHFCLTPLPNVCMCPLLLDPTPPLLQTSFMDDPKYINVYRKQYKSERGKCYSIHLCSSGESIVL